MGTSSNTYAYDCNGNQSTRTINSQSSTLTYDAENRLSAVSGTATASFVYDGDGNRVKGTVNGTTTLFIGGYYELTGSQVTMYYMAGAQRVAMRKYTVPVSMAVEYLLGDHLGSTSVTTDTSGAKVSEIRYKPWGEVRSTWTSGAVTTPSYKLANYTFTGQYSYMDDPTTQGTTEGFDLMFYNARWYDPYITQFSQPDSIIPDLYNPQDWNRYAYARYNPLKYTDPTGHDVDCGIGDKFCSDLKHEMVNSDWQKHLSFKRFISARDAYHYYYNHPDKAIDADLNLDGDYNVGLSYSLGSMYSEDVLHQAFQPYGMETLLDRIEVERKAGNGNVFWALILNLNIWFGNDGGSGGGGGGGYLDDWANVNFNSVDDAFNYHYALHGGPWSSPESYTQAAKKFYNANVNLAEPWILKDGSEGLMISTRKYYGIYTMDGKIVSFGER